MWNCENDFQRSVFRRSNSVFSPIRRSAPFGVGSFGVRSFGVGSLFGVGSISVFAHSMFGHSTSSLSAFSRWIVWTLEFSGFFEHVQYYMCKNQAISVVIQNWEPQATFSGKFLVLTVWPSLCKVLYLLLRMELHLWNITVSTKNVCKI
jgi:hypothetical protein